MELVATYLGGEIYFMTNYTNYEKTEVSHWYQGRYGLDVMYSKRLRACLEFIAEQEAEQEAQETGQLSLF